MRILLIGCVKSSELFLKKLIEIEANLVGVVTKKESKSNADFVDLGKTCQLQEIDYFYVNYINNSEAKSYIRSKNVDLILCLGWSQLLDKEILDIPRMGCIGFHPAELPHNRGRHPLIWALALGMKRTASTLFMLDTAADTGAIVSQQAIEIDYDDDANTLYDKVMEAAVIQLEELLKDFENHAVQVIPHGKEDGNSWRKRGKEDGKIDWRMSSRGIYNLVRALTKPYVGAHFVYQENEYKVWEVKERFDTGFENIEPGKVLEVISASHFIVKAGDNLIEVLNCDMLDIQVGEYL